MGRQPWRSAWRRLSRHGKTGRSRWLRVKSRAKKWRASRFPLIYNLTMLDRRQVIRVLSVAAASPLAEWAARSSVKLAHREGNMLRESSPSVYELAASIPGLSGIEVQTTRSNLWDRETVLTYKKEANRWKMRTVSMGGSLPAGGTLLQPGPAGESLRKTIRSGEI